MRLCINCVSYQQNQDTSECLEGYWTSNDKIKSKVFNPMMFECLDYEGIEDSSNFKDDHIFDLYLGMTR